MNNTKDEATGSPSKFEMTVDAFHKNSNIPWIRNSSLTERAYFGKPQLALINHQTR